METARARRIEFRVAAKMSRRRAIRRAQCGSGCGSRRQLATCSLGIGRNHPPRLRRIANCCLWKGQNCLFPKWTFCPSSKGAICALRRGIPSPRPAQRKKPRGVLPRLPSRWITRQTCRGFAGHSDIGRQRLTSTNQRGPRSATNKEAPGSAPEAS